MNAKTAATAATVPAVKIVFGSYFIVRTNAEGKQTGKSRAYISYLTDQTFTYTNGKGEVKVITKAEFITKFTKGEYNTLSLPGSAAQSVNLDFQV